MCRSPGSGSGSSHGRLRSLGIESISARCCVSRSSRRSWLGVGLGVIGVGVQGCDWVFGVGVQ
eukprot:scaffold83430_cov30-Phaeocystis_antarctica.AAC.1